MRQGQRGEVDADGIAASRPATLAALRGIPGVGDTKLEHYGDALIALVRASTG